MRGTTLKKIMSWVRISKKRDGRLPGILVDPGGGAPSQPPAKGAEAGGACSQPLEQEAAAQHRSLAGPSIRVGEWATTPGPQKNMGPPPAHPFIFYVLICIAQYPVDKF